MTRATLRIVAGFALLLLGLIGWILPIVPGWPCLLAGLLLLARHFRWPKRVLVWVRRRVRGRRPARPPVASG